MQEASSLSPSWKSLSQSSSRLFGASLAVNPQLQRWILQKWSRSCSCSLMRNSVLQLQPSECPAWARCSFLSVIETAWLGFLLSPQSSSRPASCASAPGCIRPGSASPLRSSGKTSSPALALDLLRLEPLLLPRSYNRQDSAMLLVGLSRLELVSFLLVASMSRLGLFLPTRSLAQAGVAVSVLGFSHIGPFAFPRSSGQTGPVTSACSQACSGSPLPALNFVCSELLLLLRSSGRLSLSLPASNHCKAGPAVLLQSYASSGPVPSVFGFGKLGLLLFAPDPSHCGFLAPVRSLACLGLALPATRQK